MTRWEGESVWERCGMGPCANGVKCGVVEWVKRNTLRWLRKTGQILYRYGDRTTQV